jgi:hypothetical protein
MGHKCSLVPVPQDEDGDGDGPPADDVMSASGVRSRYERLFRERQAAAAVRE